LSASQDGQLVGLEGERLDGSGVCFGGGSFCDAPSS
jgi:hypothetical protein